MIFVHRSFVRFFIFPYFAWFQCCLCVVCLLGHILFSYRVVISIIIIFYFIRFTFWFFSSVSILTAFFCLIYTMRLLFFYRCKTEEISSQKLLFFDGKPTKFYLLIAFKIRYHVRRVYLCQNLVSRHKFSTRTTMKHI